MAGYVPRPLMGELVARVDVPVLIVEGARAVGKTTAMRRLSDEGTYSYVTLADPNEREFAAKDTATWLRRLPRPSIIDEAQLLKELPLAVKEYVDGLGRGNHFILTGSASIGRAGLGGADPLTRRSLRFTMSPLTDWEAAEQAGSLVDALFDGIPASGSRTTVSDSEMLDRLSIGGFPPYRFPEGIMTTRQRLDRIRGDISSTFSDSVLPGTEVDAGIARAALDALLRTPGGIFNASRIAQALDLDRRTIDRYLSVFDRLFLVHWLPNLATSASRQNHSRAKIHPVDTSFSFESYVRAGVDLAENREAYGALLESHVINQIVAATQWATNRTEQFYWRQAGRTPAEVDLVLLDGTGRTVGVEVKAAREVSSSDLSGLRALRSERGMDRGYVFHTGSEIRELDDNIWALPISVLSDASAFGQQEFTETSKGPTMTTDVTSYDASLFLSYVHDDDKRAKGGIVQFAKDLVDTYAYLHGHDLQLFIDRSDLRWGENWQQRLDNELQSTTFLLSAITPRYLKSEACRAEVLTFASAAKEAGEPKLILGLQWIDVSDTDVVAPDDPVRKLLEQSQYLSVTDVRRIAPGSLEYDDILERTAHELKRTIDHRRQASKLGSQFVTASRAEDDRDLMEVAEAVQLAQTEMEGALASFKSSFDEIGAVSRDRPPIRTSGTYGAAAQMARLGDDLAQPVARLEVATRDLGTTWQKVDGAISRAAEILSQAPDSPQRREFKESLNGFVAALQLPGADQMEQQLSLLGNLSRHLQPLSRSVTAALRLLAGIRESAVSWRDRL